METIHKLNSILQQIALQLVQDHFSSELEGEVITAEFKDLDAEGNYTGYKPTDTGYYIYLDSVLQRAPDNVLRGALAEELASIMLREQANPIFLWFSEFLERRSDWYAARVARRQDDLVIEKGLGHFLVAYNEYLQTNLGHKFTREDGYLPAEVATRVALLPNRSGV